MVIKFLLTVGSILLLSACGGGSTAGTVDSSKIKERAIKAEDLAKLVKYRAEAQEILKVKIESTEAIPLIVAIDAYVNEKQKKVKAGEKIDKEKRKQIANALGTVWGDQLVKKEGWVWTMLDVSDEESYATVPADRSLMIAPIDFVEYCLKNPDTDCTIALTYNMLISGKIKMPANKMESVMSGVKRIQQ